MLLFSVEPEHLIRPAIVALRGAAITLFSMLAFFSISGVDRAEHVGAYLGAVALAFGLHYIAARVGVWTYRQRKAGR
jgi:hypothetical protein